MTSQKVMLTLAVLLLAGCEYLPAPKPDPLPSPYGVRRVWAIVPLRNESGSSHVEPFIVADHLVRQLENATNIDVIPLNRTLAAMEALEMKAVTSPKEVSKLIATLGVDGLIVGSVTAYDPYDPPKLGMALELYVSPGQARQENVDLRQMSRSATDATARPGTPQVQQPVVTASGFFDAADDGVRDRLYRYAATRGPEKVDKKQWHLYRISMDLYSEFVAYEMSERLLRAEVERRAPLAPPAPNDAR